MPLPDWLTKPLFRDRIERSLPIDQERGYAANGLGFLLLGVVFAGFFPVLLVVIDRLDVLRDPYFYGVFGPALLIGGAISLFGLSLILAREHFIITPHAVSYELSWMFGGAAWEQPLSAFSGVASDALVSAGANRGTILYRVYLKHRSVPEKNLMLYSTTDGIGVDSEVEALARLLRLPLLRARDDGGWDETPVDELDRPLPERSRGAASERSPLSPIPGERLRFTREGDIDLLLAPAAQPVVPVLCGGFALNCAGLAFFMRRFPHGERSALLLATAAAAATAAATLLGLSEEVLLIGAGEVCVQKQLRGWVWRRAVLRRAAVREVFVFAAKGLPASVRIVGEEGELDFGRGLDDAQRLRVKDFLTVKLSGK